MAAQSINLENLLGSYAFGANGARSGAYELNIWDDATGGLLASDNGDLSDIFITFSTTLGTLGNGGTAYNATNDTIVASQGFSGSVTSNNPGSRVVNTITILFAPHLDITNLNANFTSLNSAGTAWETSRLDILNVDGSNFSPPRAGSVSELRPNARWSVFLSGILF